MNLIINQQTSKISIPVYVFFSIPNLVYSDKLRYEIETIITESNFTDFQEVIYLFQE